MVSNNYEELKKFIAEELCISTSTIFLDTELGSDLNVDGDDAIDLLEGYSIKFNVEIKDLDIEKYFGPEASFNPITFLLNLFSSSRKLERMTVKQLLNGIDQGVLI